MHNNSLSRSQSFLLEFVFGGTAALLSKTIASPIEVVKLRLQVQQVLLTEGHISHRYQGIFDCLNRLYQENGIKAYFRGNGTNALRFFLTQALNFSFRDFFRQTLAGFSNSRKEELSFMANTLSGAAAGATTQLLVYPLDYARTRLANQVQQQFNGLSDCLIKACKKNGFLSLYKGFTVSCLCMVIYRGLNFGIYDSLRPLLSHQQGQNMLATFSLGYFATIISGACSYPLDTVRRRMMMSSLEGRKASGSWQYIKKINREGGWKAFFRGGAANVVGGLTGAAVFSVYDKFKVYYQNNYQ